MVPKTMEMYASKNFNRVCDNVRELFRETFSFTIVFDNAQQCFSKKFQSNGESAKSLHATACLGLLNLPGYYIIVLDVQRDERCVLLPCEESEDEVTLSSLGKYSKKWQRQMSKEEFMKNYLEGMVATPNYQFGAQCTCINFS